MHGVVARNASVVEVLLDLDFKKNTKVSGLIYCLILSVQGKTTTTGP